MRNILGVAVLLVSSAVFAQPIVGPEVVSERVANSNASQLFPRSAVAIARDRAGVAIAWSMPGDDGAERIHITRLDRFGRAIGATRTITAAAPADNDAMFPSLAAAPGGDGFVLTWMERRRSSPLVASIAMYGLLDSALQVSAQRVLTAMPNNAAPPIVRSGSSAWISAAGLLWRLDADGSFAGITANGVAATDMTAGDRPQLIGGERVLGPQSTCAVRDECHLLLSFYGPVCSSAPGCIIYAQSYRLSFFGKAAQSVAFPFGSDSRPAIESDGRDTLIAWWQGSQESDGQIVAARLDSSEEFGRSTQTPMTIGAFAGDTAASAVDIATDGQRYLIVWRTKSADGDHDIVAASLDREGRVTPLLIASTPADERDPSAIALGNGTFFITYEKIDGLERRIANRIVSFGARRRTAE